MVNERSKSSAQCSACQQQADFLFATKDYNKKISDTIFSIYRCRHCGFVFLKNVPDDLGVYYPQEYYPIPKDRQSLQVVAENERYKIDLLQKHVQRGRLLEIGPAYGNFAYLAKEAGFEVDGLEMSPECCTFLNEVVQVKATQTTDILASLKTLGKYDAIVLWHVFEHLTDPWPVLDSLAAHLNPDGVLLLAMPNPDSLQFRIFGRFWAHLDAPRHVCLVPSDLVIQKAAAHRLLPAELTLTDRGSLGWNSFGWQVTLMNAFTNPAMKFAMKVLGKALSIALGPVERSAKNGSCYTIVLRKQS